MSITMVNSKKKSTRISEKFVHPIEIIQATREFSSYSEL